MNSHDAIKVQVKRGDFIESQHDVCAVAVDFHGKVVFEFGSRDLFVYPRSSIKPLQAIPLFLSGAVSKFKISSEELALACASHNGEHQHTTLVTQWLARAGLTEKNLECGIHAPYHAPAAYDVVRAGDPFTQVHNNCSGKHTGMLCQALNSGDEIQNYVSVTHDVQQRIQKVLELIYDHPLKQFGVDGCSVPSFLVPIYNLAFAYARFCDFESKLTYGPICAQLYRAAVEHPYLVDGTARYCTLIMQQLKGRALVKVGAEGVMTAAIPELKVGLALKTLDGNPRAAELALSFLLNKLGILADNSDFLKPEIRNWKGLIVGKMLTYVG